MASILKKLRRREKILLGLLVPALLFTAGRWLQGGGPAAAPAAGRGRPEAPLPPVPRIDLARLQELRSSQDAGRRDLFDESGSPARNREEVEPVVVEAPRSDPGAAGSAGATDNAAVTAAAAPGLPPLNLSYIGSVENARGVKVAVLVTERREVLTGQPGQVVANRYRIARIGLESVDLEDVGTGQSRRLPLRGK